MKDLEPIFNKINELLIEELPRQIDKINKEHNDEIILEQFQNTSLEEKCDTLPCYECTLQESEYTQKDRIIEIALISLTFVIKLKPNTKKKIAHYCRYKKAIFQTFYEAQTELWDSFYDGPSNLDSIKLVWRIDN